MSSAPAKSLRLRLGLSAACLAAACFLVKPLQDRVDAARETDEPVADLLYFNSPEAVKRLALGYDGLLADVYWMRALQYYGRREEAERRAVRYGNLAPLLESTTTLDPQLLDAYRFGAPFLAEADPVGAGQPEAAIRLLDRGIAAHPEEWRLQFDKGFIYFWFARDYEKAGETWLQASRLPTAPEWMAGLAAMALSKSGAVETARMLWQRQWEESDRADVKENARNHLMSMQVDEIRWTLVFFVEKYRRSFGSRPPNLAALVRAGYLKEVPRDPLGSPFRYDPSSGEVRLDPGSKVRYLEIPYDYREAYMEKLASMFGSN